MAWKNDLRPWDGLELEDKIKDDLSFQRFSGQAFEILGRVF